MKASEPILWNTTFKVSSATYIKYSDQDERRIMKMFEIANLKKLQSKKPMPDSSIIDISLIRTNTERNSSQNISGIAQ